MTGDYSGIVLTGLNARYTHTCLAIRYLDAYLRLHWPQAPQTTLLEWTVNDPQFVILKTLYRQNARIYAFSCYIWNISLVSRICSQLKKVRPDALIIWGGPEVSHDAARSLAANAAVDLIIRGEGESTFLAFSQAVFQESGEGSWTSLQGLTWRDRATGEIHSNPAGPLLDASEWAFPYTGDELGRLSDRIIYYETSRGCPFSCSYCLSALDRTIRYRPLDKVFIELDLLLARNPLQVKLVDRTFNCQPERARQIWRYLLDQRRESGRTCFHFEVSGDLLDKDSVDLLNEAPPGYFQLEIGVQTISPDVLRAINRTFRPDALQQSVRALRRGGRVHLHLDLIAGLPGESPTQFAESFNWVYNLMPHHLQLGFLKVLPGSPVAGQAAGLGFTWQDDPPYEVIHSDAMTFADLIKLKMIGQVLDLFYNSGLFAWSISWLAARWPNPYSFYSDLALWAEAGGLIDQPLSPQARAKSLWQFALARDGQIRAGDPWLGKAWLALLRADYLAAGFKDLPEWLDCWENTEDFRQMNHEGSMRLAIRQRFPAKRHFRMERYPFDWAYLQETGLLRPGDDLAVYDLSGTKPALLDIIPMNTLY